MSSKKPDPRVQKKAEIEEFGDPKTGSERCWWCILQKLVTCYVPGERYYERFPERVGTSTNCGVCAGRGKPCHHTQQEYEAWLAAKSKRSAPEVEDLPGPSSSKRQAVINFQGYTGSQQEVVRSLVDLVEEFRPEPANPEKPTRLERIATESINASLKRARDEFGLKE